MRIKHTLSVLIIYLAVSAQISYSGTMSVYPGDVTDSEFYNTLMDKENPLHVNPISGYGYYGNFSIVQNNNTCTNAVLTFTFAKPNDADVGTGISNITLKLRIYADSFNSVYNDSIKIYLLTATRGKGLYSPTWYYYNTDAYYKWFYYSIDSPNALSCQDAHNYSIDTYGGNMFPVTVTARNDPFLDNQGFRFISEYNVNITEAWLFTGAVPSVFSGIEDNLSFLIVPSSSDNPSVNHTFVSLATDSSSGASLQITYGGGLLPTPTRTPTGPTPTYTNTVTLTPTKTVTPTPTNTGVTPTPTKTWTNWPTPTPTTTPTRTSTVTNTATATRTPTKTVTRTNTAGATPTRTLTKTITPTKTSYPTGTPTSSPTTGVTPTPTRTWTTTATRTPTSTMPSGPTLTPTPNPLLVIGPNSYPAVGTYGYIPNLKVGTLTADYSSITSGDISIEGLWLENNVTVSKSGFTAGVNKFKVTPEGSLNVDNDTYILPNGYLYLSSIAGYWYGSNYWDSANGRLYLSGADGNAELFIGRNDSPFSLKTTGVDKFEIKRGGTTYLKFDSAKWSGGGDFPLLKTAIGTSASSSDNIQLNFGPDAGAEVSQFFMRYTKNTNLLKFMTYIAPYFYEPFVFDLTNFIMSAKGIKASDSNGVKIQKSNGNDVVQFMDDLSVKYNGDTGLIQSFDTAGNIFKFGNTTTADQFTIDTDNGDTVVKGNITMADNKTLTTETIKAVDSAGVRIYNSAGTQGVTVGDHGNLTATKNIVQNEYEEMYYTPGENLVQNSSFEADGETKTASGILGWDAYRDAANSPDIVAVTDTGFGRFACKLKTSSVSFSRLAGNLFPCNYGDKFSLSFWVKALPGGTQTKAIIGLAYLASDKTTQLGANYPIYNKTDLPQTWTRYSFILTVNAAGTTYAKFLAGNFTSTADREFLIDRIEIKLLHEQEQSQSIAVVKAAADTADPYLKLGIDGGNSYYIGVDNSDSDKLKISPNEDLSSQKFMMDSSGNVDIAGVLAIRGGSPGSGKVLTSDADGDATWTTPTTHSAATMSGAYDYITLSGQDIVRGQVDLATDVTGVLADANIPSAIARDSELHSAATVSGAYDYITLSGQNIVRGQIDLATDVTGTLPDANIPAAIARDTELHSAATVSGAYDYITLSGQNIVRGQVDLATDVTGTLPDGNIPSTIARDSELHSAATVSGAYDYITLSGQDIVRGQIDLATDVTGTLPDGNIPSAIARDSELHSAATVSGAYDYITLSGQNIVRGQVDLATDVTGTLSDGNIPSTIARDSEVPGLITGGASTIASSNLTANRALQSDGSGKVSASSVTNTQLGYLTEFASSIYGKIMSRIGVGSSSDVNRMPYLKAITADGAYYDYTYDDTILEYNSTYQTFGINAAPLQGYALTVDKTGTASAPRGGVYASATVTNSDTNIGLYATAANGAENWAGWFQGDMVIGSSGSKVRFGYDNGLKLSWDTFNNQFLFGSETTQNQFSIDTDDGSVVAKGDLTLTDGKTATIETIKAVDSTGLVVKNSGGTTNLTVDNSGNATITGDVTANGGDITAVNTGGLSYVTAGNSVADGLSLYYNDADDSARIILKSGNRMAFDTNNVYTYKNFAFTGLTDPLISWGQNSDSIRYEDSAAKTEFYNGSSVVATVDHDQGDLDIEGRATIGSNAQTLTTQISAGTMQRDDVYSDAKYSAGSDKWVAGSNAGLVMLSCPLNVTPGSVINNMLIYFEMTSTDTQDIDLTLYRQYMPSMSAPATVWQNLNLHDGSAGMTDLGSGKYYYSKAVNHTVSSEYKYWLLISYDDGNSGAINGSVNGVRVVFDEVKY